MSWPPAQNYSEYQGIFSSSSQLLTSLFSTQQRIRVENTAYICMNDAWPSMLIEFTPTLSEIVIIHFAQLYENF